MKRLFVGLLALVLTVVMMPAQTMMTVQADEGTTQGEASVVNPVQRSEETIDTTKKGSLTLYKYEFTDGTTSTQAGTGEQSTIPAGATLIDGVGFTLYKISSLDDYYKGDAIELPSKDPTLIDDMKVGTEQFTVDGKVSWTELELGIYYVVETTPPVSATSGPVKSYVSIPMTTADGKSWLYDVVIYPKNSTSYASVTLKKIGNNTESNTLSGAKFILEKQDTTDKSKWYYVKNEGTVDEPKWTYSGTNKSDAYEFTTGDVGTVAISGLSYGTYRFTETYAPDGYIMDETTTYEFYIDTDGEVYTDSNKTTNYTSGVITVNNEKPDVDKEVQNVSGDWGDDADYSIGDTVPFRIVVDVPSNVEKLKYFTVTDTMSDGLKDATNFVITGYTATDISGTGTTITDVTPTINGQTWTADFSKKTIATYKKIVITFDATLDTDAVIASRGNPNDITLKYSNKILTNESEYNENTDTSEEKDRVVVYTFQIKLNKQFANSESSGTYEASFQLYRKLLDGETVADDDKATLKVGTEEITAVKVGSEETKSITGTSDLVFTFSGLENGEYYLVETDTADGYNLLKEPVKVEVAVVYETTIDEDGDSHTTAYYTDDTERAEREDTDTTTTIVNNKGFTLPVTGGMGMFSFIIVGVSMMIAAVVLLITSKKKEATNK